MMMARTLLMMILLEQMIILQSQYYLKIVIDKGESREDAAVDEEAEEMIADTDEAKTNKVKKISERRRGKQNF